MSRMPSVVRIPAAYLSKLLVFSLFSIGCSDEIDPVPPRVVASVAVSPATQALVVGDERTFTARPLDAKGELVEGRNVAWSSSDQAIATVTTGGVVTAVAPGNALIRATVDTRVGTAQLTVSLAPVAQVEVTPALVNVTEGEARVVTALARDNAGRILPGRVATWTTADPTIAEVDGTGRITAKRPGTVAVTVTVEGKAATVVVVVNRVAVASVTINPAPLVLEVGQGRQLTATTRDAAGNVLTGRAVTWTSENGNVRVSATGHVVAVSPGYGLIKAESEGKAFGAAVTITAGEPYGFDLLYSTNGGFAAASEIFILPLGSGAPPVKLNAGSVSRQPTASPSGSRVAFAVSQMDFGTGEQIDDIFAVDRNGMNMKRLTNWIGTDDQPAWSPTGGRIAFRRFELIGRSDIWLMNDNGSNPVNLTAELPMHGFYTSPAWSPDGTRLAFASMENGFAGTTSSIWTMNGDGSGKQRITSTLSGFDAQPTWSADGQRIAFIRYYNGDADITIVTLAGGASVRIPLPGRQTTPSWSPDGAYIAFTQEDVPFPMIYTVRPDGSDLRLRTVDLAWRGGFGPTWIRRP